MGANNKYEAAMHGYVPDIGLIRDAWVDSKLYHLPKSTRTALVPTAQAEFDRLIAKIKAEAKAEALTEMAKELENQLAGITRETGQTRSGRDIIRRIRARAKPYKEAPSA